MLVLFHTKNERSTISPDQIKKAFCNGHQKSGTGD